MRAVGSFALVPWVLFATAGCSSGDGATPPEGGLDGAVGGDGGSAADATPGGDAAGDGGGDGAAAPLDYADPSAWLCGGGASPDHCLEPLTATAIAPDLSQAAVPMTPATSPPVDCFYVYPTVDVTSPAGNTKDFSNLPYILDPVHEQAAPFSQVCAVYAPLYHQMTFNGYSDPAASTYLEVAYADVAAAFHQYMTAWNAGRDFVLVGHSQGSHMLRRLVQREIEGHPDVQKHLLLAILNGAFGDITVPKGQVVGGSFQSTPLCTQDAQRGCVVTVDTFASGYPPGSAYGAGYFAVPAGSDIACTNPAALGGGVAQLAASSFFTHFANPGENPPQSTGVTSTFAVLPGYYTGQCAQSSAGFSYFEVAAAPGAGDQRTNPIPFGDAYYSPAFLGLHLLDFSFPAKDLLDAVRKRTGSPPADAGGD
jgi:hypothetical protein